MAEPLGVIPKPSIYEMEYNQNAEGSLNEDGEYQNVQTLVIATPGLWDTVGPFEAIQETLSKCRDGIQPNPAEFLASKAYMRYSAKDVMLLWMIWRTVIVRACRPGEYRLAQHC